MHATRCLSLAVLNDGKSVFAGYSDATLRKWDFDSGNCTLHSQKSKKADCQIWKVKLFESVEENVIVAGDSSGELTLWDPDHGTLIKTFKQLQADILTIEVNPATKTIYASGVDARVLTIQLAADK